MSRSAAPYAPEPSAEQAKLIDDLGGPLAVSEMVRARTGHKNTPQAISMWKRRGIPYRYRAALMIEAQERGIGVPAGFLGAGAQTPDDHPMPMVQEPCQPERDDDDVPPFIAELAAAAP